MSKLSTIFFSFLLFLLFSVEPVGEGGLLIKCRCALLHLERDKQMQELSAARGGFSALHRQLQLE